MKPKTDGGLKAHMIQPPTVCLTSSAAAVPLCFWSPPTLEPNQHVAYWGPICWLLSLPRTPSPKYPCDSCPLLKIFVQIHNLHEGFPDCLILNDNFCIPSLHSLTLFSALLIYYLSASNIGYSLLVCWNLSHYNVNSVKTFDKYALDRLLTPPVISIRVINTAVHTHVLLSTLCRDGSWSTNRLRDLGPVADSQQPLTACHEVTASPGAAFQPLFILPLTQF